MIYKLHILVILFFLKIGYSQEAKPIDTSSVFGRIIISYSDGTWKNIEDTKPKKLLRDLVVCDLNYDTLFSSNFILNKANYTPDLTILKDSSLIDLYHNTKSIYLPIGGYVSSDFGKRWGKNHQGVDLSLKNGKDIYCVFDGVVRYSNYNGGYGNLIIIRHYNGLETYYAHLSSINIKVGEYVNAGDIIAIGGNTGHSTAPHLHFEIRFLNKPINPRLFFDFKERKIIKSKYLFIKKNY